jgi:hypothetical protein
MLSKGSGNLNNIELHAGFFKDIFVIEMLNQYGKQNMCILPYNMLKLKSTISLPSNHN